MSGDLGWLLAQTAHNLAVEQTARMEGLGIAPRGYCVLRAALDGEYTQGEIGQMIGVDKTTMVVTLDSLEAAGLAERRPSKTDRRARVISATAKGRKKVAEGERITADLHEEVLAELSSEQREVLLDALNQLQLGPLSDASPCQHKPRKRAPRP
ncbi:MAG: winged helix-turn-helix transcriptional regulator [Solirubrobacterales bacterium]|nr:winged helix-turn-helix transcriptional regulator [Solirubrobacterales bacterium]